MKEGWLCSETGRIRFRGVSGARGPPQFLKKRSENAGANENLSGGFAGNSGNRSESCSENCGFRIDQVARGHSENGISYSENGIFQFRELLREYPGTLRELREWPLHSESFFPEIGVVPRLLRVRFQTPNSGSFSGLTEFWRANSVSSSQPTIGNSRITFHHFIFRDLFLVIISSWFTSKYSGRFISRNLSDLHLLPHLLGVTAIIT